MTERGEEWGPWIEHDGKSVPTNVVGKFVHAKHNECGLCYRTGELTDENMNICTGNPSAWIKTVGWTTVIRYRVRKPRALIEIIERVENLPAPQPERIDA